MDTWISWVKSDFRILAVRHLAVDVNDGGIGQHGREVLLLTFYGGAVPLQGHFRQHFAEASELYISGTALFSATVNLKGLWTR